MHFSVFFAKTHFDPDFAETPSLLRALHFMEDMAIFENEATPHPTPINYDRSLINHFSAVYTVHAQILNEASSCLRIS